MGDLNLNGIEARHAAAARGPWSKCGASEGRCQCATIWGADGEAPVAVVVRSDAEVGITWPEDVFQANKDFIAEAPADIAALVAEVKKMRSQRDAVRMLLHPLREHVLSMDIGNTEMQRAIDAALGEEANSYVVDIHMGKGHGRTEMNRTAYLIAKIDMKGDIVDAQVASEFPVTQMNDGTHQVKVAEAHGSDYGEAQTKLYKQITKKYPWAFNHRTLRLQVQNLTGWRPPSDLGRLGRRGLEKK